jgi:peroxiredoxin
MSIIIIRKKLPEAVVVNKTTEAKPTAENFVRYYPEGTVIPVTLPASYVPAETNLPVGAFQKNCGNCKAYVSTTGVCSAFHAPVRTAYVCGAWHSII